jgi:hypothetical protein
MLGRSVLVLVVAVLLARPLGAEVVRLVTGEEISCRLLRHQSDEAKLAVRDLKSGEVRFLPWQDVDPRDRARLMALWSDPLRTQRGHWVRVQLENGESLLVVGLKEQELDDTILLRRAGDVVPIKKSTILEVTEDAVDPRDVWTTAQLMERLSSDLAERDQSLTSTEGRVAFRVGEHAEWAGAFEQAREAYRRAAADPAFADRIVAEERARYVEALLKEPDAVALLRELRERLRGNLFRPVRQRLADYVSKHPEMGEALRTTLAAFTSEIDAKRDLVLRYVAAYELPRICRRLIETRVKEPGLTLADARAWARKDLADAAIEALSQRMSPSDEVGVVDTLLMWQTRWDEVPKRPWLRARYGSGSFIVHPAKIKPAPAPPLAPPVILPHPPKPEEWWSTHASERAPWLLARFVEASGLFELSEEPEKTSCLGCQGEGIKSSTSQTGEVITYLCDRCGGTRFEYTVKFR